jgi:anti-anti-sigma factor
LTCESSEIFRSEVKNLLPHNQHIHVDLSDLHFMDSPGLGTILSSYISAKSAGCELKLINLTQRIKELLHPTRLASVFEGYGDSV